MISVIRKFLGNAIGGLAILAIGAANAAEIRRESVSGIPVILLSGRINDGDDKIFRHVARGIASGVVMLDSIGGNLNASIGIGRAIRDRGFYTGVSNGCVSGCALAWLGGRKRMVHREALVGFHGAFTEDKGRSEVSSKGNSLIGAYLNQLGLSQTVIHHITRTGPGEIMLLSPVQAMKMGFEVEWRDADSASYPASPYTKSEARDGAILR